MKSIILGDLHFGAKGFNQSFFDNQIRFFEEQLFPFMKENGINEIIQLGDWLDNRKNIDIRFFNEINERFCKRLHELDINFVTILGNHDIYYNTRKDINLVKYFSELYSNITVLEEMTTLDYDGLNYLMVPWLIKDTVTNDDLKHVDLCFGHFEIKNFEMTKGFTDTTSKLEAKDFKHSSRLQKVISGHYHIQSTDGFIIYVGTPYQMNWGDYNTSRGFFVLDGIEMEYHENIVSRKYVKIKYNDSKDKKIELKGITPDAQFFDCVDDLPELNDHKLKFFINEAKDKNYVEEVFELGQKDIEFTLINNVEISELIGTEFIGETNSVSATELIMNTISEKMPQLQPKLDELLDEIEEEN